MIINSSTLNALRAGFTALFVNALNVTEATYEKFCMVMTSGASEEKYGWLGQFPRMREWLGDRVINNLKEHGYSIKNKTFENTIAVKREHIEDDILGQYAPLFQTLGDEAARLPEELVYDLLRNGFSNVCYDGQYFFDTDHPVIDENGVEQSVSNTGGGSGNAWFLLDVSRPIKPLIYQKRRDPELVAKDNPEDQHVFEKNEFVYGVDLRSAAGYGLWQLAYGSKQTLNATNYDTARQNIMSRKGDKGKRLALTPNLLIVGPSNESAAKALISAQKNAAGADNIYYGTATLIVSPYLD